MVTFDRARDANLVWKHGIVHTCVDGKRINLDWQHQVDPAYVKVPAADPLLVEVLFKGVGAVITPEMLCDMLVKVKLEKRGRSAFKEGSCFHRVVNSVTGMDTDKVKVLVNQHEEDNYHWRHLIEDPTSYAKRLLVHYPSLDSTAAAVGDKGGGGAKGGKYTGHPHTCHPTARPSGRLDGRRELGGRGEKGGGGDGAGAATRGGAATVGAGPRHRAGPRRRAGPRHRAGPQRWAGPRR
ncbi:unnamed protein product [Closterium sp. NIES-65]|nr:unnamed protein product [Closterium sp. NIES-65]